MILNSLWRLIPGFVYWTLWKERNHRIFNNSIRSIEDLWLILHKIIQESLALKAWQDSDMLESQQERLILTEWNLDLKAISSAAVNPSKRSTSPTSWSPLAHNTYKLNFDGAAKGNPGLAGYGGVIRRHTSEVAQVYYGTIGTNTNNAAELEGLWKGISLAEQHQFLPLTVEGDSLILIEAAKRLQAGSKAVKIATSWRLLSRLEALEEKLHNPLNITFQHVRRTANQVADRMANHGVTQSESYFSGSLDMIDDAQLKQECINLVQKDLPPPAAGVENT